MASSWRSLYFPDWPNLSAQEARKHAYIRLIYVTALILGSVYLLKYTFQYGETGYNSVCIPLLIFVAAWPHVLRKKENLNHLALGVFPPLCIFVTIMVYTAGALQAPGTFWLIGAPVTASTLFGRRGVWFGLVYLLATLLAFGFSEMQGWVPTSIVQQMNYDAEKLTNLLMFSGYLVLTLQYYVRTEQELIKTISEKKDEAENLLRILLHDVATPLAIIRGSIDAARSLPEKPAEKPAENSAEKSADDQQKHFDRVDRALKNIIALLEKLRALRSAQDGKVHLNPTRVETVHLLKSVVQLNRERIEAKDLRVTIESSYESVHALGDEVILNAVIFPNLLTNAVKFSRPGSDIKIAIEQTANQVVVKIRDYGIGIPFTILNSLFDINVPTTRKGTAGEKGTGFGLPLVKTYLDKMGGQIKVDSKEKSAESDAESGTTVTVTLPRSEI